MVPNYISIEKVSINKEIFKRASEIEKIGLKPMDALHISSAERAADIMLTTDDEIIRKTMTNNNFITIDVYNPLRWLMDVLQG